FLLTCQQGPLLEFEGVPFLLNTPLDLCFLLLEGVAALQALRHGGLALSCAQQDVITGRDAGGVLHYGFTGLQAALSILQALLGTVAFEFEMMLCRRDGAL